MSEQKKSKKTTSFLSESLELRGALVVEGSIRLDGRLLGTLEAGGTVYLGDQAVLEGEVVTQNLISSGNIKGEIHAEDTVKIASPGSLKGNVEAASLVLEDNVFFQGKCRLLHPAKQKPPAMPIPAEPRKAIPERG